MARCYGNIGCGRSWLEIDDVPMSVMLIDDGTGLTTKDAKRVLERPDLYSQAESDRIMESIDY